MAASSSTVRTLVERMNTTAVSCDSTNVSFQHPPGSRNKGRWQALSLQCCTLSESGPRTLLLSPPLSECRGKGPALSGHGSELRSSTALQPSRWLDSETRDKQLHVLPETGR